MVGENQYERELFHFLAADESQKVGILYYTTRDYFYDEIVIWVATRSSFVPCRVWEREFFCVF